ncbi:MAG: hypothetical protein UU77_C0014G0008 [candidate division WWE3 bacterium GW2011_GWC1_41_7]|jgi:hypothetical protein|uniref:Uncharacterized protein n=4 Tax=Katanobacteria TaxID=422282 RepID=A0A0G0X6N0_UNCKA|nr:MAG: hypothetical protein UU72_C0045G0005 [candidate division WWE3 bacterium GW2011_GWB1_41_6]KKS20709.1 MAG: hypothetical protein UU80_C0045G0003 [candidate division WWE3 bacterium GW2011_GWA1_41_8]KKS20859.1 MAG: hypothetical protein UU77_C0014G0008 [candidate division WWE3 bacterium GW2011_GWC1_41_7]OGC56954.1 MAG: hypothetical protein A2976_03640 [candidate division WWE3 bacterium RIFCSPLOWO2_01_FULL_41_9]
MKNNLENNKFVKLTLDSLLVVFLVSVIILPVSSLGIGGVEKPGSEVSGDVLPSSTIRVEEGVVPLEIDRYMDEIPAGLLTDTPETTSSSTSSNLTDQELLEDMFAGN